MLASGIVSTTVNATIQDDTVALCNKIKKCTLEQLSQQELPEQMRQMVEEMVNSQCDAMSQQYEGAIADADLADKAHACVASITNKSCDELIKTGQNFNSPACTEFEKAAEEAGIEYQK